MTQKHLLILGLWLWAAALCAQSATSWTITGVVQSENNETLAGVTVIGDELCGARTDVKGRYKLVCNARPQTITVRYPGYFARRIILKNEDFKGSTAQLDIRLTEQESALAEVTISAKPIEKIVEEDFTTDLYDFGFAGDRLLLLMRERKKWLLRLVTDRGETLSEIRMPEQCQLLHRSCLGDYHAVGATFAWEVFVDGNTVDTMPRYLREQFKRFIEPCVAVSDEVYFYKKFGLLNQEVRYVAYRDGEPPKTVFQIADSRGKNAAESALSDFYANKPMIYRTRAFNFRPSILGDPNAEFDPALNNPDALIADACHDCYDQIYRMTELELIRRDSVYAPMIKIGDTLCLFDHIHGQLIRFGPQVERSEVIPIDYFKEKGWNKLLLYDEVSHRIYARFTEKGGLVLKEINPRTGQVAGTYDLRIAPLVAEKFRIRNGMLYYIGQPNIEVPNKMLYKMNVFAGKRP